MSRIYSSSCSNGSRSRSSRPLINYSICLIFCEFGLFVAIVYIFLPDNKAQVITAIFKNLLNPFNFGSIKFVLH